VKVLSIDLDYIMAPCIELYHGLQWCENPNSRWSGLYDNTNFKEHQFYIDQGNLLYCYDLFLKALGNCKSVSFGYEHDELLYTLQDKEDIEIINIDHHDDVFGEDYEGNIEREYVGLVEHDRVNEGNWGAWLHLQKKLDSFIWIRNESSRNFHQHNDLNMEVLGKKYKAFLRDDYEFEDYNFDHIFVCLSPQYVPKNHWHYFTMFIMAYEQITGKTVDINSFAKRKFEYEIRHNQVTNEILHKRPNGG
jgi:hypothetical protein